MSRHLLANYSSHQRLLRHRAWTSLVEEEYHWDVTAAEMLSQKAALRSSHPHSKQQKSQQAGARAADRETLAGHSQHIVCKSCESMAGSQERERTVLVI